MIRLAVFSLALLFSTAAYSDECDKMIENAKAGRRTADIVIRVTEITHNKLLLAKATNDPEARAIRSDFINYLLTVADLEAVLRDEVYLILNAGCFDDNHPAFDYLFAQPLFNSIERNKRYIRPSILRLESR